MTQRPDGEAMQTGPDPLSRYRRLWRAGIRLDSGLARIIVAVIIGSSTRSISVGDGSAAGVSISMVSPSVFTTR